MLKFLKKIPLDFLAFSIPVAVIVGFYVFNVDPIYLASIGIPLSIVIYVLRLRSMSSNDENRKSSNISLVVGFIFLVLIYIYYNYILV